MTVNNPAYFFFPTARPERRADAAARAFEKRARASTRSTRVSFDVAETQAWRGFQRARVFSFRFFQRVRVAREACRERCRRPVPEEKNSGPRRPPISRRTSPIARKCANFFRPRAALATAAAVVDAGERAVRRRDEGERTRPTATRRRASSSGVADTTVRRSRTPTRASRAHRVRTRACVRWKRFTWPAKTPARADKGDARSPRRPPPTTPRVRVIAPSRRADGRRVAASATRKWRRDKSQDTDAARELGVPCRPSPDLHACRRSLRSATMAIVATAPSAPNPRASAVRIAHAQATRDAATIVTRQPRAEPSRRKSP
ncbi:hypothetical protein ACLMLE_20815 [Lysobacter capsici]